MFPTTPSPTPPMSNVPLSEQYRPCTAYLVEMRMTLNPHINRAQAPKLKVSIMDQLCYQKFNVMSSYHLEILFLKLVADPIS